MMSLLIGVILLLLAGALSTILGIDIPSVIALFILIPTGTLLVHEGLLSKE